MEGDLASPNIPVVPQITVPDDLAMFWPELVAELEQKDMDNMRLYLNDSHFFYFNTYIWWRIISDEKNICIKSTKYVSSHKLELYWLEKMQNLKKKFQKF